LKFDASSKHMCVPLMMHLSRHRFREMCDNAPAVEALKFLQSNVADIVDHSTSEADTFRGLLAHLLTKQRAPRNAQAQISSLSKEALSETLQARTRVFESLLELFPADAKEPVPNLIDMLDWYEESAHG
jgi:hypothetical protein